jgi:hypothetical protein
MFSQHFKLAVGTVLDAAKVAILDLEPTGAHNVLPENKLLKEGSVAAKDVRVSLTGCWVDWGF